MTKPSFYVIIILMFLGTSCNATQAQKAKDGLGSIDLPPDNKRIVFSYYKNDVAKIYLAKVNGDSVVTILSSTSDTSYVHPKFSFDGEKILFLAFSKDKKQSNIFISDKYGKHKRQITFQNDLITEATFSFNNERIYYCKAATYQQYSPIGRKAPHDFDIYQIDIHDGKEKRITDFRAYNISSLTETIGGRYILARLDDENNMGIRAVSTSNPKDVKSIIPVNDPRGMPSMYSNPIYSRVFNKLVFTAPYELYIMDLDGKIAQLIYRPKDNDLGHIHNVLIFNNQERILFKKEGDIDAFRTVNFDGSNSTITHIEMPK